ncbi:dUTPase [Peribacillus muralis]|uniref:dUTP diphosphatase n=1 Tax=Peribacillus muralis TaxID=264697 RepID=UPI001F4EC02E|nr:dUTP diphosphatase [Peribacillus muralis]MCK1991792.1 dUTP diphosphatase [Peribacillus muralis]MCK2012350.1 dUTP diphosphatase [Peribacillus muralis]
MNIGKLFDMQAALDEHIQAKHELGAENLVERKILALLVELGELANETRCFKFWSLKGPAEKETVLAEYVDGIHFILSLGIDLGFVPEIQAVRKKQESDLTTQFIAIYGYISEFRTVLNEAAFQKVFREYLYLGEMLGFSAVDVEQAYVSKNEVNYERQKQGY